jgi:hypothetical protein
MMPATAVSLPNGADHPAAASLARSPHPLQPLQLLQQLRKACHPISLSPERPQKEQRSSRLTH